MGRGESKWSVCAVFWKVGVRGPFAPLAFLRFLYSFRETDFLVEGGVFDSAWGGDLRCLGVESLREFVVLSSRLRFWGGGEDSLPSFELRN